MKSAIFPACSQAKRCLVLGAGLLALLCQAFPQIGQANRARDEEAGGDNRAVELGLVEVRFTDNSILKLKLIDEYIMLATPYGKLRIPVSDISRIEFGTRLSTETASQIESAIANLGSPQFQQRETASADLLKLREKAYTALLQAVRLKDPEVVRRAEALLVRIRETVPAEQLEFRKFDVVHTENSKISGRIEGAALKARTSQFGEVSLKLFDLRSLRSQANDVSELSAGPDPGTLTQVQNEIGKTFAYRVTGALVNSVWGSDVYTTDSLLAAAAVHAGVLKPGQSGVVRVKIVAPPPLFMGSIRNGISSGSYGVFRGAYQILR